MSIIAKINLFKEEIMYFLSIMFIFVSQTILFGQNNCEGLTQNECNETLTCTWSIVSSPNGFFEMLKELIKWIGIIIVFGMFILWMEGAFTKGCLQLLFTMV